MWLVYGFTLFVAAFIPLLVGPDSPSVDAASASMTMTFVVMGLGTIFNAITNRRDPSSGLTPPILKAVMIGLVPAAMFVLATQLPFLQSALRTTPLSGWQWLSAIGLALLLPLVIEVGKAIRRRRLPPPAWVDVQHAVNPERALHPAEL
jgi:Ca2+-transporting ATPase